MELLVDPISNYPKKHYKIANKILCGGGGGGEGEDSCENYILEPYCQMDWHYKIKHKKPNPFTHSECSDFEQPI